MSYRRYNMTRSSNVNSQLVVRIWISSVVAVIGLYIALFSSGQAQETWTIVHQNFHFYLVLGIMAVFGLWWWKKNETFSTKELAAYMAWVPFSVYPVICFGFLFLTDVHDVEVWNGVPIEAEYTERYYTESTSTDDDGKTTTTTTWHGPYYNLESSVGLVSLNEKQWKNWVSFWGGRRRVTERSNISADGPIGAGIQTITWDGRDETRIPVSTENTYVNYVKGDDSTRMTGQTAGYEELLKPYPKVRNSTYGRIAFDRVILATASVGDNFVSIVDGGLDKELRTLGARKQVNIVVYVAGTSDIGFFYALQDHWSMGKKNDVCVVIGYENQKISWSQIMCYTENELFKEKLGMAVRNLKTLEGNGTALVDIIINQIKAPGEEGFDRLSMEHFKYLASDIPMAWWADILVIMAGLLLQLPTIWLFCKD